jgi:ribosomal protein S21
VKEDGVLMEIRERRYFRKPSEIRRKAENEIRRKYQKINSTRGR